MRRATRRIQAHHLHKSNKYLKKTPAPACHSPSFYPIANPVVGRCGAAVLTQFATLMAPMSCFRPAMRKGSAQHRSWAVGFRASHLVGEYIRFGHTGIFKGVQLELKFLAIC
jgi:hypothetical protein